MIRSNTRQLALAIAIVATNAVSALAGGLELLNLVVNRVDGHVALVNPSTSLNPIAFDFYQVESATGSLDFDLWSSLQDQEIDKVGDGPGEQWQEFGASNEFLLGEAYLASSSTLAPGESYSLGNPYRLDGFEDIEFSYGVTNFTAILNGPVIYVPEPSTCWLILSGCIVGAMRHRRR